MGFSTSYALSGSLCLYVLCMFCIMICVLYRLCIPCTRYVVAIGSLFIIWMIVRFWVGIGPAAYLQVMHLSPPRGMDIAVGTAVRRGRMPHTAF